MKSFKRVLPVIAFCVLPLLSEISAAADNQGGLYLGGGIGYSRMNGEDYTNTNGDLSKSQVAWKALVGMRLNSNLSLEAQYLDFGAANRDNDRIQASGYSGGVVLDFMQGSTIAPYAKVGALVWETDNRFNNISRNDNGTDVTGGLGLRFAVGEHMSIRTEYERFMMDNTDVDSLSVNLQYNFY